MNKEKQNEEEKSTQKCKVVNSRQSYHMMIVASKSLEKIEKKQMNAAESWRVSGVP